VGSIDIQKQIDHWKNGAIEDWDVAQDLINDNKIRHGLFFAHLALEKILKAYVCRDTQDLAPKIHNLSRLVRRTTLTLNQKQEDILAEMNAFNLEGRYPDLLIPPPTKKEAKDYMRRAKKVYEWLLNQL
jgi:HEPN domain-containing protein